MFKLKIKKYRLIKGMTQKELSEKSKVDQTYISRLEQYDRHRSPTLHVIETLAEALEICPKRLLECNCKECRRRKRGEPFK